MNKEQKIEYLEQQLISINQEINDLKKTEKWEPKGGDWFIDDICSIGNSSSSDEYRQYGVEFETKEKAEKASKDYRFYHRLYKLAEELNDGWVADINDITQLKTTILYNALLKKYCIEISESILHASAIYFKDNKTVQKAIEILERGDV